MRDEVDGVGLAVPFRVPLTADTGLGPRLGYGPLPIRPIDDERPLDVLLFHLEDDSIGRVTFEGLDSIPACRGELLPYERQDIPYTRGEWVYIIQGSGWLQERHRYEFGHYETPLLDRYDHYLFSFHDEFIEAIALGVWFDKPSPAELLRHRDHPLQELPLTAVVERSTSFGIEWELLANPESNQRLVANSRLCSQRALQYNLVLDGRSKEHASVWIRTRHERTTSSFVTGYLSINLVKVDGVADAGTFLDHWLSRVEAVAERRRSMGLP